MSIFILNSHPSKCLWKVFFEETVIWSFCHSMNAVSCTPNFCCYSLFFQSHYSREIVVFCYVMHAPAATVFCLLQM